jgi:regulator of sigma E protease
VPLGGYVKMAGDEPGEKLHNKKWEFLSRSIADRFKIIFAGPVLNYLLAFVIFSVIFMFGSPTLTTEVGGLLKDYPAEKAGVAVGDKVVAHDGKTVDYWEDMTEMLRKKTEGPVLLTVMRGGKALNRSVSPVVRRTKDIFGKEVTIALVGISPSQKIEKIKYPFGRAIYMGAKKLVDLSAITYKALWSMAIGRLSVKESLTGPIGIYVITGQAAKMGLIYLFHLMGILSASLAIFNMLPLPVLDGGHILFLAVEKVRGKPLSVKAQELIANAGVAFLIILTVFIFYNDLAKFGVMGKIAGIVKK